MGIDELLEKLHKLVRRESIEKAGFDTTYVDDVEGLLEESGRTLKSLRARKEMMGRNIPPGRR